MDLSKRIMVEVEAANICKNIQYKMLSSAVLYIVHGSENIESIRIDSKKFIQVEVDELCMYTDFSGCDLFGFGDIATLKNGHISLSTHEL